QSSTWGLLPMAGPDRRLYSEGVDYDERGRCTAAGCWRQTAGRGARDMNTTQGMNVEEVRRMAGQLHEAAEEITRIEQELTSGLEGVDWTGPDAERFRGQWSGEMVPALQQIMNAVRDLGDSADRNASQQETTSTS